LWIVFAFDTALGTCGIAWSEAGVTGVSLPGSQRLVHAGAPASASAPAGMPHGVREAAAGIARLLSGARADLTGVILDERGLDPFRRAVFAATRAVGPGATASYGEIARAIGAADAARAVGAALGSNPWPIVVPCHRILAADGALTGFSAPGGVATKRRMLEIEGAPGFTQEALFA
jgi:methylated-DNA-[protein]-cysteine S-methyltransferase